MSTPATPTEPPATPPSPIKSALMSALQLAVPDDGPAVVPPAPPTDRDLMYRDARLSDIVGNLNAPATPAPVVPPAEPPATPAAVVVPPATPPPAPKSKSFPVETIQPVPEYQPPTDALSLTDLGDLNDLSDDERQELELARFAEVNQPSKYPGRAKATLDYIRAHRQFVQRHAGDSDNIEEDSRYKEFVKANRLSFANSERARLLTAKIKEETKAEIMRDLGTSQIKELQAEVHALKVRPQIDRTLQAFADHANGLLPGGGDPLAQSVSQEVLSTARQAAEEFIAISSRLKSYNNTNPVHSWLANFIEDQGRIFASSKDPGTKKGGKTFVPRSSYANMNQKDQSNHFTFTDEDVLHLLAANAATAANELVAKERAKLEKYGYAPKAAAPAAPVVPPTTPSPRAPSGVATPPAVVPPSEPTNPFMRFMHNETRTPAPTSVR